MTRRMRPRHTLLMAAGVLWVAAAAPSGAYACACCTNTAQRNVGVYELDSSKRGEIDQLRFGALAHLYTGEADADAIKGIATPSVRYTLSVAQHADRWLFSFGDAEGRSGTLTLAIPKSIAVFEVDPRRDEREGGLGPALYKEWRLTSPAAGTGIFTPGMGKGQLVTLILQGDGNNCHSAADFTHWTLVVSGPIAGYHLYGGLLQR
jgi:hypothetical protein